MVIGGFDFETFYLVAYFPAAIDHFQIGRFRSVRQRSLEKVSFAVADGRTISRIGFLANAAKAQVEHAHEARINHPNDPIG
jgi:hypothetical protein